MRLVCYKAMCGDSFHLQYMGESGKCRNILLDMGYSQTYTTVLKDVINKLLAKSEQIDGLFLSHIHDDHIGGARKFIKDIQLNVFPNESVGRWVYNAPRRYIVEKTNNNKNGVLCGIASGDKVYEYIMAKRPSNLVDFLSGQTFTVDGMKVTILSPDEKRLDQLRNKYSNNRPLCTSETDTVSVEAGNVVDDYSTPLDKFKVERFQEDNSIENASSIAAMFEYGERRILWLSDSVPSVIIKSLMDLGYSEKNKVQCDAVLISHHGSLANNSLSLFKMISSDRFIISADGINRHCLPNKETIARLISATPRKPVALYFNYSDGRLMRMFNTDAPEEVKSMIDARYLKDKEAIKF
ncbi:Metal-dependent hydrolase, beta-lactamase superfamily II [Segatella oulorum]|uniref:Metal-dependent hydrolase, beta-lactamase superfamily II n=1 Tax=Segatella oulorum TaxID=28136 RepID=A0A1T4N6W2_9BACT|nr:MBL fold metallo-hydrolase [Segatella oulorum]SJZ74913.1 Metal-dependent hydrolase, beta-lactamase superfamily II [Segatella oulorum]